MSGPRLEQPASHVLMVTGSRSWNLPQLTGQAISDLFDTWLVGSTAVTNPVLFSGACPQGADHLAEKFWAQPQLPIRRFHADWSSQGPRAGFIRNQAMVDEAVSARSTGAVVSVLVFADLCQKEQCGDSDQHQLMDDLHFPGHFSHGTMRARQMALNAGLQVRTIIHPMLPPF